MKILICSSPGEGGGGGAKAISKKKWKYKAYAQSLNFSRNLQEASMKETKHQGHTMPSITFDSIFIDIFPRYWG